MNAASSPDPTERSTTISTGGLPELGIDRRRFVQAATLLAAGGALAGGTSGRAAAAETTDLKTWFENVENFSGVVDERGSSLVLVEVGAAGNGGGFAYEPACVRVDPGTTVRFEWTGDGGAHDVTAEDESYASDLVGDAGHTFEHLFADEGVSTYYCSPHISMGMKGAVVVGDVDVGLAAPAPATDEDGDAGADEELAYLGREPDYVGWFAATDNYRRTVDMRGQSLVRIQVGADGNGGGYAISPPAVAIDPGTEVLWEWVGEDGPHGFRADDGSYESPSQDVGDWGLVFDGVGISKYACLPHAPEGMRGAIVVGDPYEGLLRLTGDELAAAGGVGLFSALVGVFLAAVREGNEQE
jgi:halocyanin-like protein